MLSLCSPGTFKNGWFRVNGTPKRKNFQAVENSCERNLTQTKKTTLHVYHDCLYISSPSLQDYDLKMSPTFYKVSEWE